MRETIKRYLPTITLMIGMVMGSSGTSIALGSVALSDIKYLKDRMDIVEGLLREIAQTKHIEKG